MWTDIVRFLQCGSRNGGCHGIQMGHDGIQPDLGGTPRLWCGSKLGYLNNWMVGTMLMLYKPFGKLSFNFCSNPAFARICFHPQTGRDVPNLPWTPGPRTRETPPEQITNVLVSNATSRSEEKSKKPLFLKCVYAKVKDFPHVLRFNQVNWHIIYIYISKYT